MDGGALSQDEINALLAGMGGSSDESSDAGAAPVIDDDPPEELLTEMERDAVGEVANISMGSSATTLYSLVNRKVNITTPVVTMAKWGNVLSEYEKPCVFIQIKYTQGLDGSDILILKEHDVKVITDLMMGGDGSNTDGELGELHLSAISEAMNQMMGSSATSLSTMLNKLIDISPPVASLVDITSFQSGEEIAEFLGGTFVKISFRMQIFDDPENLLVDSTILQLYPVDFAKELCDIFLGGGSDSSAAPAPEPAPAPAPTPAPAPAMNDNAMSGMGMQQPGMMPGAGMQQPGMGVDQTVMMPGMQPGMQPGMMPGGGMPYMDPSQYGMQPGMMPYPYMMPPPMNIQPAQFQKLSTDYSSLPGAENIQIIKDVPLEVTVELGRTVKSIAEILDFAPGTIIELDKIAGESVDVLVNGKYVARGEVVVVEESFGVRVTDIIK